MIVCRLFAGALDAPSVESVSYHAVCAVISVSSDVTFHDIQGFFRGIPLSLILVCTSGPLQKWHVQMVIVIACCIFGGSAGRAPWNTRL